MVKIFRYLRSSFLVLFFIIVLLVTQAYLDLTLPEYTSKIINVGVQQGGIEDGAILEIGGDSLEKLLEFMSFEDANFVLENYDTTINYKGEAIYELSSFSNRDKLNDVFIDPMNVVYTLESSDFLESMDLPTDTNIYSMIDVMNDEEKSFFLESVYSKIDKTPKSIKESVAVSFIKKEYTRIDKDTDLLQKTYILKTGLIMALISLGAMGISLFVIYLGSQLAAVLARNIRKSVFNKVINFSKNEVKKFGEASLITRTTNDIQQIQQVIVFLTRVVIYAPIIAIGGLLKANATNSDMTFIIWIALICIVFIMLVLFVIAMPKFKLMQKLVDKLNLVSKEILTGLPVIRAFSNEKIEEEKFSKANKSVVKNNKFVNYVMNFMMPSMMFVMSGISLGIVFYGAYSADEGVMQVGDIMEYIQYTMQIVMAFIMVGVMAVTLPRANVAAKRVLEVLDTKNTVKSIRKGVEISSRRRSVEFKNVSFKYKNSNDNLLDKINFIAKEGTTTAFIGSTGSGKSTLINLIPRFIEVSEGSVLVNGVDVRNAKTKDLRQKIGLVPQKSVLFSGTVRDNISFGNKVVDDKVIFKALDIAQASPFVSEYSDKLDHVISQGGANLSGGQKQRLSIARAIVKDPDVLIFDDSFSALDYKTDLKLRNELATITKKKIVLIVAQRISTIMNCDNIIVLDKGRIVGKGKHNTLMKKCDVYKEIALSQLSKEELEDVEILEKKCEK